MGRSYGVEGEYARQVLDELEYRRADCEHPQGEGSCAVRPHSTVCLASYDSLMYFCRIDNAAIGPGIGPAAVPAPLTSLPPAPVSLPAPPLQSGAPGGAAYSAATVSSGPQPASLYPPQPPPVMLPPLHYQGLDSAQPFGYQPPQGMPPMYPGRPGMPPPQQQQMPVQAGQIRSADEMDGAEENMPPPKRIKVPKLPPGQYYPEQEWMNMHSVRFFPSS